MRRLLLQNRLILPELNVIVMNGVSVHVEPKAMEVFLELANHPGEVLSKAQLIQSVWNGVFVCEEVVTNAISLLRRALSDETKGPGLIQTIPKRGYRLMVPPQREATAEAALSTVLSANTCGSPSPSTDIGAASSAANPIHDLNQALLRARYLRHEETIASLQSACAYCEEIIRQEPNCAAAYAELVLALFLLEKLGAVRREHIELRIRASIDRALCLNERASTSLLCLAKQEYRYDWQWEKAEQHFRKAVEADPHDADVFNEFSILLSVRRRFEESLSCAQRACLLDPLSPAARLQAGHANYASGQWEAAAIHYRRLLRCTPGHVFARWGLADALTRSGKPSDAIIVLQEGLSVGGADPNPLLLTSLSRTKVVVEGAKKGPLAAQELQQTSDPLLLAELYGSLGDLGKAFNQLNQAADIRHYRLSAVNMFPQFEPIREDSCYQRLLKRVGLG